MSASAVMMSAPALRNKHYSERASFPSDLEVLVVDSNKTSVDTMRKVLVSCNYRVTVCKNCAEAVAVLARKAIDVIAIEMRLYSVQEHGVSQLKLVASRIPIVLVSDVGSRKDVWSAIATGAADIISKPLSRPKLQTLWQHVIRTQGPCMPSTAAPAMVVETLAALAPAAQRQVFAVKPELSATKHDVKVAIPQQPQQQQAGASEDDKSRKRKAKEVSGGVAQSPRPLLAVKASAPAASPATMTTTLALPQGVHSMAAMHPHHHAAGPVMPHPHASLMGYWGPPMMTPPTMIPGHPHMSWGHPVMGLPAGHPVQQHAPGIMAAHPGWMHPQLHAGVPPHMIAHSCAPVPAPPASGAMVVAQPVQTVAPFVPTQPASSPTTTKQGVIATSKAPDSPESSKSYESMASAQSEQGVLGMLLADGGDLVTIPEPSSPPLSEPESCFTSDPGGACAATQLDDISEEDYAFIDFALSDDFPACHEDEIVPPLNISLKKSDSLLNLLNVQMVF